MLLLAKIRYKSRFSGSRDFAPWNPVHVSQHREHPISPFPSVQLASPFTSSLHIDYRGLLSSSSTLEYILSYHYHTRRSEAYAVPGRPIELVVSHRRAAFPEQTQDSNYQISLTIYLGSFLRDISILPSMPPQSHQTANLESVFYAGTIC